MKQKWSKAILIFILSFLIVGIAFLKTNKGKIALEPLRNEKAPLLMPRMILLREQQGAYFQLFLQEQQEIDPFPIAFDCYAGPDFQEAVAHNYIDEQFVWLTNNSTVEMIEQLAKYEALWRAEIDQSLVALEDLLYPHEYSLLIQAQDEWGKYVDKCFAFDVSLYKPLSSESFCQG